MLAGAIFWSWRRWAPAVQPLLHAQGRLEADVNRVLATSGVSDSDIRRHERRVHGRGGISWLEVRRTVVVAPNVKARCVERLAGLERKPLIWVSVISSKTAPTQVTFRLLGLPLQHLTFEPIAAKSKSNVTTPLAAIVIDDVGYSLSTMDEFAELGIPLTLAILPGDRRAPALAEKAHRLGFSVIMHLPLEPSDMEHNNPGTAALYLKMNESDMQKQFERNVARVPHLVGWNNHMGSAFTENEAAMTRVLRWGHSKQLFYLDSRTSPKSVGTKVANRLGIPNLVNQTFLDNADELVAIESQLDQMVKRAKKYRQTVAIGHYRRKYLREALERKLPDIKAAGVQLVTLPALIGAAR